MPEILSISESIVFVSVWFLFRNLNISISISEGVFNPRFFIVFYLSTKWEILLLTTSCFLSKYIWIFLSSSIFFSVLPYVENEVHGLIEYFFILYDLNGYDMFLEYDVISREKVYVMFLECCPIVFADLARLCFKSGLEFC